MKMNYEAVSGKNIGYLTIQVDGPYWQKAQEAIRTARKQEEADLFEAVNLIAKPLYEAGIRHFHLITADDPKLEIGSLSEAGAMLRFTVLLPPVAEVTKYTGFGIRRAAVCIDEIAVNRELEKQHIVLTDETVQALRIPDVSTVSQYRSHIAAKLRAEAEAEAEAEFTSAILAAVAAHTEVEIPEAMIIREMQLMKEDLLTKLSQQGLTLKEYIASTGKDEDSFAGEMYAQARERVVLQLAMHRIAELEHITVTDEELEQHRQKLAASFHTSTEALSRSISEDVLRENLRMNKVTAFLRANAA